MFFPVHDYSGWEKQSHICFHYERALSARPDTLTRPPYKEVPPRVRGTTPLRWRDYHRLQGKCFCRFCGWELSMVGQILQRNHSYSWNQSPPAYSFLHQILLPYSYLLSIWFLHGEVFAEPRLWKVTAMMQYHERSCFRCDRQQQYCDNRFWWTPAHVEAEPFALYVSFHQEYFRFHNRRYRNWLPTRFDYVFRLPIRNNGYARSAIPTLKSSLGSCLYSKPWLFEVQYLESDLQLRYGFPSFSNRSKTASPYSFRQTRLWADSAFCSFPAFSRLLSPI